MTDQELQQLAKEYAEAYLPEQDSASDMARYGRMKDSSMHFLRWLTKTHCIVSREAILSQHAYYMLRMKEVSSARQTNRAKAIALEAVFGKSTFKNPNSTKQ